MAKHYLNLSKILQRLLFEKKMKPVDLAREVNLPQPTVHRLVTGKSTRPYKSSLKPIADYFSITVDQLIGEDALEADNEAVAFFPDKHKGFKKIPIIDWDGTSEFITKAINPNPHRFTMGSTNLGEGAFATQMNDSSMEPVFQRDATLVFDPKEQPKDRDYVLVKLKDVPSPILRWLLIDGEDKYLKPLNPDLSSFKMRLMEEGDEILAVLSEARTSFQRT